MKEGSGLMCIYNKNEMEDITLEVTARLLWKMLVENDEHQLLYKLNIMEKYNIGSMIIPSGAKGFSYDNEIHNLVIEWLKLKGINVWNPENEIIKLEEVALHG